MRFSLIIPAHNAAEYIRKGLESVRAQHFTDYELIVVCDACEDDTAEIAREYTDHVIEVDFHDPGLTRSAGLDAATGDWVLFQDDDDWWLHEFAFNHIDDLLSDDIDLLCFGFIWKGRGYAAPVRPNNSYWPAVWSKAWRRSFIGETRFPDVYPDDWLFHCEMMAKHPRARHFNMPLYYYNYWRPGSISAQREKDLRMFK